MVGTYIRGELNAHNNKKQLQVFKVDTINSINTKIDSKMELLHRSSDVIIHKKLKTINDKIDKKVQQKLDYYDTISGIVSYKKID